MAATLSSLTSKRATIFVPLDPDAPVDPENPNKNMVRVVYRPKSITGDLFRRIDTAGKEFMSPELAGPEQTIKMFVQVVTEWDLKITESDDGPIPITEEALGGVPTAFLSDILQKAFEDQAPDPTTQK